VRAAAGLVLMAPESPSPVDPAAAEAQRVQDAADAKQRAADQEKERLALAAAAAAAAKERVRAALEALELERRTAADLERKAADAHKLANPPSTTTPAPMTTSTTTLRMKPPSSGYCGIFGA